MRTLKDVLAPADSVTQIGERPSGVSLWACAECGDAKRWCPRCEQGWLRRVRVTRIEQDLFSCDECDATWTDAGSICSPGVDLQTFLVARFPDWLKGDSSDLTIVRETERDLLSNRDDR